MSIIESTVWTDGDVRLVLHEEAGLHPSTRYYRLEAGVGEQHLLLSRRQMVGVAMAAINSLVSSPGPMAP